MELELEFRYRNSSTLLFSGGNVIFGRRILTVIKLHQFVFPVTHPMIYKLPYLKISHPPYTLLRIFKVEIVYYVTMKMVIRGREGGGGKGVLEIFFGNFFLRKNHISLLKITLSS